MLHNFHAFLKCQQGFVLHFQYAVVNLSLPVNRMKMTINLNLDHCYDNAYHFDFQSEYSTDPVRV